MVGHPGRTISSELVIDGGTARAIDRSLEKADGFRAIDTLGVLRYGLWDRVLVVTTPEGGRSVRFGDLTRAQSAKLARAAAGLRDVQIGRARGGRGEGSAVKADLDDGAQRPRRRVRLVNRDGNAFNVLDLALRALREAGWSKEERDVFLAEATSGDYATCWGR